MASIRNWKLRLRFGMNYYVCFSMIHELVSCTCLTQTNSAERATPSNTSLLLALRRNPLWILERALLRPMRSGILPTNTPTCGMCSK